MIIKYFAWLKKITSTDVENITNENIKDIETLKYHLCKKYPELKKFMIENDVVRIAINLEYTTTNKKLEDSDEIAFFPPVSGG